MNDMVIISYKDQKLGTYFEKCKLDLTNYISTNNTIKLKIYNYTNKKSFFDKIKTLSDNYYIVVYAHGSEKSILDDFNSIIISEDDVSNFHNSIFYSTACNNAVSLGYSLIRYGSKLFFGYNDVSYGIEDGGNKKIDKYFIDSDNYAIKKILSGEKNGERIYSETHDFIYKQFKELEKEDEVLAPFLFHNLEAMRIMEHPDKRYY